jgi:hypothetical protein
MKSLIISTDKMPYTIRAMMRIIVMQSKKLARQDGPTRKTESGKIKLETSEIYMLADILIGCWLNTGFRNSSCFGVL